MSDTDNYSLLRIRAFNDLTNRAKPGIFIYATVWFAIAFALELPEQNPVFFGINSSIVMFFFIARSIHLVLRGKVDSKNVNLLENTLIAFILLGALHWGVMSALVFYNHTLQNIEAPLLIVLAAFAMGGTSTLSISHNIRVYYPAFLLLPSVFVFFWEGSSYGILYGCLIMVSWVYIFFASASAEHDYWQAISHSLIAEDRAKELEALSVTDPLTQLKNRMYFDEEYDKEWQRSARLNCSISVLMVDLDYFKKLNDNYGHVFGDEVLQAVAKCLDGCVMRPTDCVARYGGEEFIVLLPNTDAHGTHVVAERFIKSVAGLRFEHEGTTVKVTCSIGGATAYPQPSDDRAQLVKAADEALYEAKESGRNRFVIAKEEAVADIPKISG